MDTSIRITTTTRDKLVAIGKKNESYDTLLNRLIDQYSRFSGKHYSLRDEK